MARIFGISIEKAKEASILLEGILTEHEVETPVPLPDISTKEKAQDYLGLDMEICERQKEKFNMGKRLTQVATISSVDV